MAAGYNDTSAYDFSRFARQPEPERERAQKPALRVVRASRQFLVSAVTPQNICLALAAVVVACLIVYNYVRLNELNGRINALSRELTVLQSNHVIIQSELGASSAVRIIAERAESELGLKKLDKYQTEYLYIYKEDRIETAEMPESKGTFLRLKVAVNGWIDSFKEYIR